MEKWAEQKSNTLMLVWAALNGPCPIFNGTIYQSILFNNRQWHIWIFHYPGLCSYCLTFYWSNPPTETRTYCITTYNVLPSFVAFLAPQIGILLLEGLGIQKSMDLIRS